MKEGWRDRIQAALPTARVRFDQPLRNATTLRIGGPADCFAEIEEEEELGALLGVVGEYCLPFFILGKGSNVLVPDEGLRGVVVRLGRGFGSVAIKGTAVSAGAGCANAAFVERCRVAGLGGMEFLIAVPGTIGGAVAMNAGAHDGETARILAAVRYFQIGEGLREEAASAFSFAYRHSPLQGQQGRIVLSADFRLEPRPKEQIAERVAAFQTYRRETQPRDFPNCGSVFKNPPGDFAARLIEAAGLKGKILGNAQVSEKHANFIVNRGGAMASEVLALVDLIRENVYSQSGIVLDLELQVLSGSAPAAG